MTLRIEGKPSPNHDARPAGTAPDMLILHYTGMTSAEAAIARLCDPAARVSSHYVVEEDGRLWRLVPEERRAWHAGESFWAGRRDINAHSIGVEIVNPGHEFGYRPFPAAQMDAVAALAKEISARNPILPRFVIGHSDVAPHRKQDPGELFDWAWLARQGVGLFPDFAAARAETPRDLAEAQAALARIGYEIPVTGVLDQRTAQVLIAFQRHYRPRDCSGTLDDETGRRIGVLAASV